MKTRRTKTRKHDRKKTVVPRSHGPNINAPRLFEDGELVVFIQYIYGMSVCFGTGVIAETKDLPYGYGPTYGKTSVQYVIKGRRVFFHEGDRHKDNGKYQTWLGASRITIVPRSAKSVAWLKQSIRDWKDHLKHHQTLLTNMRLQAL